MRTFPLRKPLLLSLALCLLWLVCLPASSHLAPQTAVNAVIGDISFYNRFHTLPSDGTDENLRIQTHLDYVEKLLRSRIPASIPAELYPRRQKMLALLHTYRQQGVFPTQQAYRGRRPHFIDEQSRLCAVGYLIAKTAGQGMAERINRQFSYAYLPEMNVPELQAWAEKSGLTLEELAMIQPTYGDHAGLSGPSYEQIMIVTLGLETTLLLFHILAEELISKETYQSLQVADVILTVTSGLMHLSLLASAVTAPEYLSLKANTPVVAVSFAALSVPNAYLLHPLGLWAHQNDAQVSLGMFETKFTSSIWGLKLSTVF